METKIGFMQFLRLFALCLIFMTGTFALQAQRRDRDEGGDRGDKHSEYRYDNRRDYSRNDKRGHYEGREYYRRAPWGYHRPYILYHNHGRVYYYGGHYYEYYPGRGYLMIEIPSDYFFDSVPPGFGRVWIDGRWCHRRGDLYLRPGVHGYIAFPGPGFRVGVGF